MSNFFVATILILFSSSIVLAHGDAHGGSVPHKSVTQPPRSTASKPALLAPFMIQTILDGDHVPEDVVLIKCNLTESTSCRGISISLSDAGGTRVLLGHSGVDGWVGFQGLSKELEYKIKIESAKYAGEVPVRPGVVHRISALRVENKN